MRSKFAQYFNQKQGDIQTQRKNITEILTAGPASVSKIAEVTNFDVGLVVWNLVGMLRWGEVEVASEENHELVFALKEV
jgi:hypothetical protein